LNSTYSITGLDYGQESSAAGYYSVDLSDLGSVHKVAEDIPGCDALIFLVGLAHKKGKGKEIDEFRSINKQTLVNLLTSLKENNKLPSKIIFASTISVYGEKMNSGEYVEESECSPQSPYAITKREAENYLLSEFPNQSWILRFAPVYSDSFKLNIDRRTKAVGMSYKVGNGTNKLSLCNMENIKVAIDGILKEKVPAGVYNISDAIEYSFNDLLHYVHAKWTIPIPKFVVKGLYVFGKIINNNFLKENSIKLLSDNIYPSDKIRKYVNLNFNL